MSNAEFTTPPNKTIVNNSEITNKEKIVIAVLLLIMCLLLIAIGQKILATPPSVPIAHNSIIAGGLRPPFSSRQYTFSLEEQKTINVKRPNNLGDYAEWSPDGEWIVFSRQESIGDGHSEARIYIMQADGSQQTLVPIPHGGEQPTWSPDGKQIAFYRAGWGAGIYITNIECLLSGETCTPEVRLLVEQPGGYKISSPDWSPDGRQIAYAGIKHISIINVDEQSQARDLTPYFSGASSQPQWSPDGTKIVAMCSGEISGTGICVMNQDGSNLVYLKRDPTFRYTHQPRWSPDGQKIAYISQSANDPILGACINPDGCNGGYPIYPTSVFIMNADGSGITHLPLEDDVVIEWFYWYP